MEYRWLQVANDEDEGGDYWVMLDKTDLDDTSAAYAVVSGSDADGWAIDCELPFGLRKARLAGINLPLVFGVAEAMAADPHNADPCTEDCMTLCVHGTSQRQYGTYDER